MGTPNQASETGCENLLSSAVSFRTFLHLLGWGGGGPCTHLGRRGPEVASLPGRTRLRGGAGRRMLISMCVSLIYKPHRYLLNVCSLPGTTAGYEDEKHLPPGSDCCTKSLKDGLQNSTPSRTGESEHCVSLRETHHRLHPKRRTSVWTRAREEVNSPRLCYL